MAFSLRSGRSAVRAEALGATVLDNLRENVRLSFTSKLPEVDWRPELGFLEIDPEFDSVPLGPPKRVTGTTVVSKQMLIQGAGSPSMDTFLLNELSRSCSSQLDRICLVGNPTAFPDQPRGIKFTPGIHTLDIGVQPPWEFLVEAERLVEVENVAMGTFAYLTSPDVKRLLRTTLREVGGDTMVWEALERAFSSNEVDTDEIFFGPFNQLVIGIWSATILVNPYSRATAALTELVADLYCSLAIRRAACFGLATITIPPGPIPLRRAAEVKVKPGQAELTVKPGKPAVAPEPTPEAPAEPASPSEPVVGFGSSDPASQARKKPEKGAFR